MSPPGSLAREGALDLRLGVDGRRVDSFGKGVGLPRVLLTLAICRSGLLAGDRLMLDLHNLERAFVETNYRTHELEQSFSLARFDPDALWKLKSDQACEFEIPERYFDLTYRGHYRRRIKAVRLTIPCVVGPHTSVGATLRLIGSHVRTEPHVESSVPVPLAAHDDGGHQPRRERRTGVFEFSFRDDRSMPFEGAGVNSRWELKLPAAVKPFDYRTISDVILRISYTAEEDAMLSIRNDFPAAWNTLLDTPFFMSGFDLEPTQSR